MGRLRVVGAMKKLSLKTGLVLFTILSLASPALAAKPKASAPAVVDNSPVVTSDTSAPPNGTASPSGTVQVAPVGASAAPPAAYTIPIGGAKASAAVPASTMQPPPAPPAPPSPPPGPPVVERAEQCLRANLDRVLRAEPSAKLAVDLLLSDVCADEVDLASQYVRNVDVLAQYNPKSERGRAGLSTAHVDPETGQIVAPQNVDVSGAIEAASQGDLVVASGLRKYAAELVLTEKARPAAPSPHVATTPKKAH
jgi:hypothetical protein